MAFTAPYKIKNVEMVVKGTDRSSACISPSLLVRPFPGIFTATVHTIISCSRGSFDLDPRTCVSENALACAQAMRAQSRKPLPAPQVLMSLVGHKRTLR